MPIVNSEIVTDRQQRGGMRKIRQKFTDHLGDDHFRQFIESADYDAVAGLIVGEALVLAGLVEQEVQQAIKDYENGEDPLHYEASSNNWQQITPEFQTWDELAAPVLVHFLEKENRNDLAVIESTIIRISTQDKKALLGMTTKEVSAVNGDIQAAVNAIAELALYSPHFVGGEKA